MSLLSEVIRAALGFQGANSGVPVALPSELLDTIEKDAVAAISRLNPVNDGWFNMYAQHRSHSSHSSHSSHYSSSGGGSYRPAYTPPPPKPAPPPPLPVAPPPATSPSTLYTPAAPAQSKPKRPSADELKTMIMRVQAALFARGYDPGAIDGVLSDETKSALRAFQSSHGLAVTGTMTTQTLTALNVSVR